ncbi:hypothetical protein BCV69DRAFT_50135 [Microstroma glucosiphilum]|uniref:Uncharacterized protein n=1 Tax=Pseudomicrostroma glucosiphilum TaxID=1684307 RepID=A0A316U1Q3_9BASI|nr:hypothetical protein BCV69DRAFT_50135 [Pseudomicrostroma glucosiphilum]PWN19302.1 hypothetical protein BCV69DRAFT_50135 [Pseudomicrostroma glucosiphilum]
MPRSSRPHNPPRPVSSHRLDRQDRGTSSSPLTPPAHVQARKRESQKQHTLSSTEFSATQDHIDTSSSPQATETMAATRTRSQFQSPPLSAPRHPRSNNRRKDDVRPERKASVRKEQYDLDEDDDDDEDDEDDGEERRQAIGLYEDDDESDLSDAPPVPGEEGSSAGGQLDQSDFSDDDMAAKLQAAGDGESLLGSGDSDDGQEDDEERYIIADAAKAESKANARLERLKLLEAKRAEQRRRRATNSNGNRSQFEEDAQDGDIEDLQMGDAEEDFGSLSPETMRLLGLPVLEDELFHEQEGFHSDSEPSFSDFFGSDGEGIQPDDDDELTSFDTSDEDDDISDLEDALVGEPFLAHVGAVDPAGGTSAVDLAAAMQAGVDIARQDIPLLVIEDLDGRLIYARAGDGEAVFGSDGEFEFVDSDEDDDSDDDDIGHALDARDPRWATPGWRAAGRGREDDAQVFEDDGDTTDELPDEDMPFPRLLVGSVDPRGGRTSRRARAMAAQLRRLSPNGTSAGGKRGQDSAAVPADDATSSVGSSTTPATEVDVPFPPVAESSKQGQAKANVDGAEASGSTATAVPLPPATPSAKDRSATSHASLAKSAQGSRPEMGSFMPSSSKSVHRAVIDGSSQAASPFTSKYSLQRKGLAGKRRPRRSSFSSHDTKRMRRSSLPIGSGDHFSEAVLSSPETIKTPAPLPMDLDDVVDASMLWRSGDSSDTGTGDGLDEDSNASDDTTMPSASKRTRSHTEQSSGGFGLNSNAFSRWRKIPMGAFRDQQQSLSRGRGASPVNGNSNSSAGPSRGRGRTATHQPLGNLLLQRVNSPADRRFDHSPFRRTGSHGGSLHMVVPSVSAAAQDNAGSHQHQQSFIVSPVLWPVRGTRRGSIEESDSTSITKRLDERDGGLNLRGASPFAQSSTVSDTGSRKMTKREKRERKAQRATARAAARAEKQRLREEGLASASVLGAGGEGDDATKGTGDAATLQAPPPLPRTPNLGDASGSGPRRALTPQDALSPATAMPRLRITEPSPRSSPAPPTLQQNGTAASAAAAEHDSSVATWQRNQQQQPSGAQSDTASAYLPGDTPPTKAVAVGSSTGLGGSSSANIAPRNTHPTSSSGAAPSSSSPSSATPSMAPSMSMFGPPLASPLFGAGLGGGGGQGAAHLR